MITIYDLHWFTVWIQMVNCVYRASADDLFKLPTVEELKITKDLPLSMEKRHKQRFREG